MTTTVQTSNPKFSSLSSSGQMLAGGRLYTYSAGTTTPLATYTDYDGLVPNANPVILDARGEATVRRTVGVAYKFVLKDASDVTIWTLDNILDDADALRLDLASTASGKGSFLIGGGGRHVAIGQGSSFDADAAFAANSQLRIARGETVKIVCDPTGGDDLQAMAKWACGEHFREEGAELYIEIADGLHDVSTFIDVTDRRHLDIRATATPDLHTISSFTITSLGANLYEADVTVTVALPSRVVAGYAVGCQNVKGDNGADSINGAHIVTSVAVDRLSCKFQYRSLGVAPTTPTTLDGTTTLGLTANQLVVPKCCLRANSAGWDGSAREGFINALTGGAVRLSYLGISYNGATSEHDILFARDEGACFHLEDRVVIAGAGDKVLRMSGDAQMTVNRSYLGGGTTGAEICSGIFGSTASFTRTMMGSASTALLTATYGCNFGLTQSRMTGTTHANRCTSADAAINITDTHITHSTNGITATKGEVMTDTASSIRLCTTPISMGGGNVHGDPQGSIDFDAQTANFALSVTLYGATSGATATIRAQSDAGATGTLTVNDLVGAFVDNETITTDTLIAYGTQTANFTAGQVLTGGTSGATGTIRSVTDFGVTGTLSLNTTTVVGTFQVGEIVTDGAGGSATVTTVTAGGSATLAKVVASNLAVTGGINGNTNATIQPNTTLLGGVWARSNTNNILGALIGGSYTIDFPSVAAQSFEDLTFPLPGAVLGDAVIWARTTTWPSVALHFNAFVSSTNFVTLRAINPTAGAINPTAFNVRFSLVKMA